MPCLELSTIKWSPLSWILLETTLADLAIKVHSVKCSRCSVQMVKQHFYICLHNRLTFTTLRKTRWTKMLSVVTVHRYEAKDNEDKNVCVKNKYQKPVGNTELNGVSCVTHSREFNDLTLCTFLQNMTCLQTMNASGDNRNKPYAVPVQCT
jgi:hypothetical protein